ncbi:MAG: amino acid adenylation domain-containing protein [Hyphomicrobiales bacterium]
MAALHKILIEAAKRDADAIAVTDDRCIISYGELDQASTKMARRLTQYGIGKADRVGIWIEKSVEAIIVMQATMRIGAVYVPLDPRSPPSRVTRILTNCEVAVVVTSADQLGTLKRPPDCGAILIEDDTASPEHGPYDTDLICETDPEDLAYILHTSGSTGEPKGVCVSHRAAVAFVEWATQEIAPTKVDRFANHAPFHFDLSVLDIYVSMQASAQLFLISDSISYKPSSLTEFIERYAITIWYSVPSVLILMLEHGALENRKHQLALRLVCFAGEVFPVGPLRRLRNMFPEVRLLNLYGPTETNVCTYFEVKEIPLDRIDAMPIGKACRGTDVWLHNEAGVDSLPGDVGELVVEGPTVMSGYWGNHRQEGPYHTGDLVRIDAEGQFTYVGRIDHMIKIRGYRVEPGEIETALYAQLGSDIIEVAVVAAATMETVRLRACIVAKSGKAPSLLRCKQACAAVLPRYMIVDEVMQFSELARTSNGKIDREFLASLPNPLESNITNAGTSERVRGLPKS